MARSDLLKQLFAAHSRADDAAFRAVAERIVADERRLGHRLLAADLEHALHREKSSMTDGAMTLRPLPKGRDERPLLALAKPVRELHDLVLKTETRSIIDELAEENRSRSLLAGHRLTPRRRLLFIGDPGTGKTASAHALASELSLPVATVALPAVMSSYLGETAKNVEAVLRFAELTPCVVVFDEFDAIAAERGGGNDHGEMRRVMATILQVIESVQGESLIVATSNHPQLLDSAIWRRFDEVIYFPRLDVKGVEALIHLKLQGVPTRVSPDRWAKELQDFSPAEIELILLDAQRKWVLSGSKSLGESHLRAALSRRVQASVATSMLNLDTRGNSAP